MRTLKKILQDNTTRKKVKIAAIVLRVLLFCFVVGLFLLYLIQPFLRMGNTTHRMFESLEDFEKLNGLETGEAPADRSLGDLRYTDAICCSVDYHGTNFYVYAYVFADEASAQTYFNRAADRDAARDPDSYSKSTMFSGRFVAYAQNRAYRISGGTYFTTTVDDFLEWLSEDFPIQVWPRAN